MTTFLLLVAFAAIAFVQNMAFTWVSRSRNSGDPQYHRYASWASNAVWFVTNILVWTQVWSAIQKGTWVQLALGGVVYVLATTEGSVFMMKRLLKSESGKRRVGAAG